ncbi:hypothetical protein A7X67_01775 [Clostridium sp. W14A]|nr:hypothetical protein A7X67_01775 [Clostridium sp. W14A]
MKKSKIRIFVCLMAAVSCTAAFSVNALAYSEGKTSPTLSSSSAAQNSTVSSSASSATSTSSETSLKPLTPDGTGTVIDNVTNEDGKEFFTITTPSKHVFYLIIDRQKDAENVYFLDAVTDKDLLALAKSDNEDVSSSSSSKTASAPETSSAPTASTPNSQPEKQNSSAGIAAVAALAAVLIGAAVWFFKFRKPGKKDKNKPDPDDNDYADDGDEESEPDNEPDSPDEETEQKDEPEASDGETEREDE